VNTEINDQSKRRACIHCPKCMSQKRIRVHPE
jgi:hypothetical protein